jgi:integral membrane protein
MADAGKGRAPGELCGEGFLTCGESVLSTAIGRLRVIGMVEGISFLLLLGVAMPLKYLAGIPEAVRVVGMAHGLLWILFVASVAEVWAVHRWPKPRVLWAIVSSVIPFGTFVLDAQLRAEQTLQQAPVRVPG